MDKSISKNKLFTASCISLIVTAMTFAIRAGILTDLGLQFELNDTQLGYVNSLAFFGSVSYTHLTLPTIYSV